MNYKGRSLEVLVRFGPQKPALFTNNFSHNSSNFLPQPTSHQTDQISLAQLWEIEDQVSLILWVSDDDSFLSLKPAVRRMRLLTRWARSRGRIQRSNAIIHRHYRTCAEHSLSSITVSTPLCSHHHRAIHVSTLRSQIYWQLTSAIFEVAIQKYSLSSTPSPSGKAAQCFTIVSNSAPAVCIYHHSIPFSTLRDRICWPLASAIFEVGICPHHLPLKEQSFATVSKSAPIAPSTILSTLQLSTLEIESADNWLAQSLNLPSSNISIHRLRLRGPEQRFEIVSTCTLRALKSSLSGPLLNSGMC